MRRRDLDRRLQEAEAKLRARKSDNPSVDARVLLILAVELGNMQPSESWAEAFARALNLQGPRELAQHLVEAPEFISASAADALVSLIQATPIAEPFDLDRWLDARVQASPNWVGQDRRAQEMLSLAPDPRTRRCAGEPSNG